MLVRRVDIEFHGDVVALALYEQLPVSEFVSILTTLLPNLRGEIILGFKTVVGVVSPTKLLHCLDIVENTVVDCIVRTADHHPALNLNHAVVETIHDASPAILESSGLIVVEFTREGLWDDLGFYFLSQSYSMHARFLTVNVDANPLFSRDQGVDYLPSYGFYYKGFKVALLQAPDQSQIKALIETSFVRRHRRKMERLYIRAEEEEKLIAEDLMKVIGKVAQSKMTMKDGLKMVQSGQSRTMMESLFDELHSFMIVFDEQGILHKHEIEHIDQLIQEKDFLALTAMIQFLDHGDRDQLVIDLREVIRSDALNLTRQRLEYIVLLENEGAIDSGSAFYMGKLLQQNQRETIQAFNDFERHGDYTKLADELTEALNKSGLSDIQSSGDEHDFDVMNLKLESPLEALMVGHPFYHFVETLVKKDSLHREDISQIVRMILSEVPTVMAAFDVYLVDGDWDELVDTLQCILRFQVTDEMVLLERVLEDMIEQNALDEKLRLALQPQIDARDDVMLAAFSLFLEDEDVDEFVDTLQRLVASSPPPSTSNSPKPPKRSNGLKESVSLVAVNAPYSDSEEEPTDEDEAAQLQKRRKEKVNPKLN